MTALHDAAKALIERWDMPLETNWNEHSAVLIDRLRTALKNEERIGTHDAARLAPYDDSKELVQALREIADSDPDATVSYWLNEAAVHIAGLWEAANSVAATKNHIGTHGPDLRSAILAAGAELGNVHQWLFEEGADAPEENSCFVEVLEKHLAPLLDPNFKQRRIAVLEAELTALRA